VRRKTPQEKKQYSYARDRRNVYGENDKSSRKNIPRRKRAPHRANRRRAGQILETIEGAVDEVAEEGAEMRLSSRRPKSWKKVPDKPLGEIVQNRLERRVTFARARR
jgi:hypothetical protein